MVYTTAVALSVAGAILSIYLLDESRVLGSGFCEISERMSCLSVIRSRYSKFLEIPVAFYGLVWFITSGVFSFSALKLRRARLLLFVWSIAGMAGVLFLNYVELVLINAFCMYCGLAHALAASILGLSFLGWRAGV